MKMFSLKNIILVISIMANIFFAIHIYVDQTTSPSDPFPLLSPRIFAINQNDILINFIPLRNKLTDYMNKKGNAYGLYFEYLPSGNSIGVNEKRQYVFASLLKVPLVMGVYHRIEQGKIYPTQVLTIRKENLDPYFGELWKQGVGAQITLIDAIRLTLTKSDNTAKSLLFYAVPAGTIEDVFDALDIPKSLDGNQTVVTPKNYSSILKSLYLASYDNKKDSNEILNFMTQSNFDDKIAFPIPDNIKVAHKIGVYEPTDVQNSIYTDCGIIYYPKRPYLLCAMAQSDEPSARAFMIDVSKIIYDYIKVANNN